MRELFRTLPLMCVVLLIPVVPFLFFGADFEAAAQQLASDPPAPAITAAIITTLLATDILLPIPSSVVITLAGWQLGKWAGAAAAWLGLNLGAVLGFGLARRWGQPFARWFTKESELRTVKQLSDHYGPLILILTRAVPVFAEASVLMAGLHQMNWKRFLVPVVFSNLGIALAYATFGEFAETHQWLPLALSVSIALPVLLAVAAQRFLPQEYPSSLRANAAPPSNGPADSSPETEG